MFIRKLFSRKIIIIFIMFFILSVCFIYGFSRDDNNEIVYNNFIISSGHSGRIDKYDPSYSVEGYQGKGNDAYYITGNISSSKKRGFTVIVFDLYDKDDKMLGTAVSGLKSMNANKNYHFKALALVKDDDLSKIDYYKLGSIK